MRAAPWMPGTSPSVTVTLLIGAEQGLPPTIYACDNVGMPPGAGLTIVALAANIVFAAIATLFAPQLFPHSPLLCMAVALTGCSAALATLFRFAANGTLLVITFWTLIGHGAALIVLFAGIYHGFGLVHSGPAGPVSLADGLYFSIVTWTTLGYGDFTPPADIRLIAAMQALLGYAFFVIIVGLGTDRLISRTVQR